MSQFFLNKCYENYAIVIFHLMKHEIFFKKDKKEF